MDAFILAAGLGTRLRPLTDALPKALVPVAGVPMLERVARRLIEAGADRLVVNVHHHAGQVVAFLEEQDGFGVPWAISPEIERPLDTGGALLQARDLLRRDVPFYLHNVDVIAGFPLADMYEAHRAADALATVAVSGRASSRGLLFGPSGLCGRVDGTRTYEVRAQPASAAAANVEVRARPPAVDGVDGADGVNGAGGLQGRFAFSGVHVISPRILDRITETGAFPVLDLYLRLVAVGERVAGYRIDGYPWFDIGSAEKLAAAEEALAG
jgi:NDP-sugar pyrophosphorylase family protein